EREHLREASGVASMANEQKYPALKHGAYSATAVLPGENQAEFEKLQSELISEFAPTGAIEKDIVTDIARLVWRKQNLRTLRTAERAQQRRKRIEKPEFLMPLEVVAFARMAAKPDPEKEQQRATERAAREAAAHEELGALYELTEAGEA